MNQNKGNEIGKPMNFFERKVNIDDEDLLTTVRSLDQKGLQQIFHILDASRSLIRISENNWYFANLLEHNCEHPTVAMYQSVLNMLEALSNLAIWEITSKHVAEVIKVVDVLKNKLIEINERAVVSNTLFTSEVEFARVTLPVIVGLSNTLEALWLASGRNVLNSMVLEADENVIPDVKEFLDKSEFDRLAEFCDPELSKVERPEDANFYLLLGKLMYVSRQMRDAPSTSKTLMGKHIKDILKLSTNFMDSRGQNIITELVDAQ